MSAEINALLAEYADAMAHASDDRNGSGPFEVLDGVRCTAPMARFYRAERAVFSLDGRPDAPSVVTTFIAANKDRGCSGCWLSSIRGRNHPACNEKIDRYFRARDAIQDYGKALIKKAGR